MPYVDGFVLPVPRKNLKAYAKMSKQASKIWMEHGAIEYRECAGDDLKCEGMLPFTKLAKTKPGETVVFAWILYESKAQRDEVNGKVMQDPRIAKMMQNKKVPFDCKRMAYGGFKVFVEGKPRKKTK